MDTLPVGLHQLSLEENPWICDCRLWSLRRWLASTRTPLSSPVRCPGRLALGGSLEQLAEQELVCAPKWAPETSLSGLVAYLEPTLVQCRNRSSCQLANKSAQELERKSVPVKARRSVQVNEGKLPSRPNEL